MNEPNKNWEQKKLMLEDSFRFSCHHGVSCFTTCCRDINIFLTPYDLLRMKNQLGISSGECIDKYTEVVSGAKHIIPLLVIKMNETDKKCPFVGDKGCEIYDVRPWACRMYPIDMDQEGDFFTMDVADRCFGLNEDRQYYLSEYLEDQGLINLRDVEDSFNELTANERLRDVEVDNDAIKKMVFMATYNIDEFRRFVFGSSFLSKFDIPQTRVEKIKRNDVELLKLAFDWIKFGLLGRIVLKVKDEIVEAHAKDIAAEEDGQ
ncbi:MAG: YkgJ family cysteine cluster protein [Deltaproteobacteria bacterium]|nr:YkgJ family cysteine cluster protein [Deltaproteobacteria bacterium]